MIYNNVKKISKQKGISINKLEADCGFSKGSICKWNSIQPGVNKVSKVAEYLGVPLESLISHDNTTQVQ